jgi:hypothetical protein
MEREFKVGDKIVVVNCSSGEHNGKKGVVIKNDRTDSLPFHVELQDCVTEWFSESEIQSIEEPKPIKDTRLERLEDLIKAVNVLGGLGLEVALKITVEIDGKKIEL